MDEIVPDLENLKRFRPDKPHVVPEALGVKTRDPSGYIPDPGLIDAVRVALHLRKPLLLTGEPGTGKTDLAFYLSWKLGHVDEHGKSRNPLVFVAKSDSVGSDLFYTYDTIGRFRAKEGDPRSPMDFVSLNALGLAMVWANPVSIKSRLYEKFKHPGQQQSVVLIDEVDKAPRDFPNDILDELDRKQFSIKEIPGEAFTTPPGMEPIVVVTSNLEKNLPGPFLRRCVFYHIPFPEDRLADIIARRVEFFSTDNAKDSALLSNAIELFLGLRSSELDLQKKPATGELLDWLLYLVRRRVDENLQLSTPLWERPELLKSSLSALIKDGQDLTVARQYLEDWLKKKQLKKP